MVEALTPTATTIDLVKTILYEVSLRKVHSEHVKHKVIQYSSWVPRGNAWPE